MGIGIVPFSNFRKRDDSVMSAISDSSSREEFLDTILGFSVVEASFYDSPSFLFIVGGRMYYGVLDISKFSNLVVEMVGENPGLETSGKNKLASNWSPADKHTQRRSGYSITQKEYSNLVKNLGTREKQVANTIINSILKCCIHPFSDCETSHRIVFSDPEDAKRLLSCISGASVMFPLISGFEGKLESVSVKLKKISSHRSEIDLNVRSRDGRELRNMDIQRREYPIPIGVVMQAAHTASIDGRINVTSKDGIFELGKEFRDISIVEITRDDTGKLYSIWNPYSILNIKSSLMINSRSEDEPYWGKISSHSAILITKIRNLIRSIESFSSAPQKTAENRNGTIGFF